MKYLLTCFVILLTSCIQIGDSAAPQEYFLLESPPVITETFPDVRRNIDISEIRVPAYLDRASIVLHDQQNKVSISPNSRWAEPLPDNLMRVIRSSLSQQFPHALLSMGPWDQPREESLEVSVTINRFSGTPSQAAYTDISWTLTDIDGTTTRGHFKKTSPAGDGLPGLIQVLNRDLNEFVNVLARQISASAHSAGQ